MVVTTLLESPALPLDRTRNFGEDHIVKLSPFSPRVFFLTWSHSLQALRNTRQIVRVLVTLVCDHCHTSVTGVSFVPRDPDVKCFFQQEAAPFF